MKIKLTYSRTISPGCPFSMKALIVGYSEDCCAASAGVSQGLSSSACDRAAINRGDCDRGIINNTVYYHIGNRIGYRDRVGCNFGNFPGQLIFLCERIFRRVNFYTMILQFIRPLSLGWLWYCHL